MVVHDGSDSGGTGRGMICDVRLQRLELDLVSHNGSLTTLDIISTDLDRFRPPSRGDSRPDFRLGRPKWGYGDD